MARATLKELREDYDHIRSPAVRRAHEVWLRARPRCDVCNEWTTLANTGLCYHCYLKEPGR